MFTTVVELHDSYLTDSILASTVVACEPDVTRLPSSAAAEMTDRRDTLVAAALDLFASQGIDRVSMDDIARRAGVTKGSLYWHFDTKREVILAAASLYYGVWRTSMRSVIEDAPTPYDALTEAISFSVRSCLLDQGNRTFTTEIIALALHDDELRASWAGFYDEALRLFLRLTDRAVGSGQLVCDDVDTRVDVMLAAMEGLKQTAMFSPGLVSPDRGERLGRQLLDLLSPQPPVDLQPTRAAPPLRL